MVYPFYYCFVQSFNDGYDSRAGGVYWFPREFTLMNYDTMFANPNIIQTFVTTVLRTVVGTATSVFFTAMFAYGLSKNIAFRKTYSILSLITMYFSGGLIPFYFLIKSLGHDRHLLGVHRAKPVVLLQRAALHGPTSAQSPPRWRSRR